MWTRAVSLRLALNLVLCRPNRANDFWGSWDHFGGSWRHFGSSWGNVNFGDSWKGLGASLGGLRVTLGALGTIEEPWDVLGRLWGLSTVSGVYLGDISLRAGGISLEYIYILGIFPLGRHTGGGALPCQHLCKPETPS